KAGLDKVLKFLSDLREPHAYRDSVKWHLGPEGLVIESGPPETFGGEPVTVRRVWNDFRPAIEEWAVKFGVPVELIIATICTETRGDPEAVREEPGFVSDEHTPNKVSPGLMQTLISTARDVLGDDSIDRQWLLVPQNSIRAGTALMARQWKATHLDPPKVACAYNAGGIYYNGSRENRWRMRQYPINSSDHADRFVKWFNECFVMFEKDGTTAAPSFFTLLNERTGRSSGAKESGAG
ncbi:MAG: lytic transglycosylase domain-containing protein, partial [Nitrospirae bacterium]|nr:lytic transglycosylase domain-containing protein [Nitrospirota bacterium]